MRATLVLTDGEPFLQMKEFILPSTPKQKDPSTCMNEEPYGTICHQSLLEAGPASLIKALGQRQDNISHILSVLDDTYQHLK